MNEDIWHRYLRELLLYDIEEPSVLLVDNLDCHVSQKSEDIVAGELACELKPLPANSTSVCQPLDVGVMGPIKSMLRTAWLAEDGLAEATAQQKRRTMVDRVIRVWEAFDEETIRKSFGKAFPYAEV